MKELKISAITRQACEGTYDLADNAHIVDVIALLPNDSSHRSLTTVLSGQPSVIHSTASLCWLTTSVFQIGASDCGRKCRCQQLTESTLYIPGTSNRRIVTPRPGWCRFIFALPRDMVSRCTCRGRIGNRCSMFNKMLLLVCGCSVLSQRNTQHTQHYTPPVVKCCSLPKQNLYAFAILL